MSSSFEFTNQREKPFLSFFAPFFARFLPQERGKQIIFFQLLGPFFLFITSLFAFLYLEDLGRFFPFVGGLGLYTVAFGRKYGLALISLLVSLALFFLTRSPHFPLFSLLGTGVAVFLSFTISFLASEESSELLVELENKTTKEKQRTTEMFQALLKKEEETKSLEQELERWKEEAEQRKIENVKQGQKLKLLEGEVKNYIAQKETLLNESFEARAKEHEAVLSSRETHLYSKSLEERIETLTKQLDEANQAAPPIQDTTAQAKIVQLEGVLKQLRSQFEEKKEILHATRKELFASTGKLLAVEKERLLTDPDLSEITALHQLVVEAEQENGELHQLIDLLESFIHHLLKK